MLPAKRLTRSAEDRMIFGVCGGIAQRYGWDPTLVRLVALASLLPLHLVAVVVYGVLAFVLPKESESLPPV